MGSRVGRRAGRLGVAAVVIAGGLYLWPGPERLATVPRLLYGSPHQRYAAKLTWNGRADTDAGRRWLEEAQSAMARAEVAALPFQQALSFPADRPEATAFASALRRGQRYTVEARVADGDATTLFVDVFARDEDGFSRVASAAPDERAVILELTSDADYVVRVQPELGREVRGTLILRAGPSLQLPVDGAEPSSIHSLFGDARDGGSRAHHGVDIFAARGTSVLAAASGIVSRVGTNALGGNVVWVARPLRGETHYYAHLDRQLVTPGTLVDAGDVIGTVGNTGNARGTRPHLHFGIYAGGEAVDPLPYIAPAH
jgi:murein DD-endopeptidase MepM/ murein hydrolase activator NlpD